MKALTIALLLFASSTPVTDCEEYKKLSEKRWQMIVKQTAVIQKLNHENKAYSDSMNVIRKSVKFHKIFD